MNSSEMFMGKNGFYWWFGTVEDNGDPLSLGRCRVRITGWHNEDFIILPSDALPWAYPLSSIDNTAISGIGKKTMGPVPGTRVFGFFLDGESGQQPIIMHTVPGMTNVEHGRRTPVGSVPWFPNFNFNFLSRETHKSEGENPLAGNGSQTTNNIIVPDYEVIKNLDPSEWVLPASGFVSAPYGDPHRQSRHVGVDICPAGFFKQTEPGAKHLNGAMKGPTGLPVVSAAAGEVVWVQTSDVGQRGIFSDYDKNGPKNGGRDGRRSYGNVVGIRHNLSSGTFTTIYAHLGLSQDPSLDQPGAGVLVRVGDKVSKGQIIGNMGRSHCWDVLTHLHFEIRTDTGLPKSTNAINPGQIFPQLLSRHTGFDSAARNAIKYDQDLGLTASVMPVVQGKGPA